MPVVGMIIKNINAKKSDDFNGQAQIGNNASIKNISEESLPAIGRSSLKVGFEYKSEYHDDKKKMFGEISISGDVFFADGPNEKVVESWRKEKKLPDNVNLNIINAVLHKCMIESLGLSEKLQLPPPVALPFAQPNTPRVDEKSRYIG